ncbi:MAG TPA: class I SAM-dependent methyltransferase [Sediminibacterium sp.]|jgi:SAM-dependent methyltransferase|nr:MAG: hypothetical protein B7Y19_04935 [Sphingobacteriales bacterium 24-40-4]HQS56504.1 class I SAM-dependent methyltransferase [Sediminibacterium sp.]
MENQRDEFWNQRYQSETYVYGEEPNDFFASQIVDIKPGNIIFPCEGEGRNAVYAAILGWKVQAFDGSLEGQKKAFLLASKNKVSIDYKVTDATIVEYPVESVDMVVFIYAHFAPDIRKSIHQKAIHWLKPGGRIILEAFNPNQVYNQSGGPKDPAMLYTKEIVTEDFEGLETNWLENIQKELKEGPFHNGLADVIQYVGIKK